MHAKRTSALLDAVEALLFGKKLSLSLLARNLQTKTKERHCIRKIDRLLGNTKLHSDIQSCYHAHCMLLVGKIHRPIISVDWAAKDKRKDWHILRATLNIDKRGYVLYQEVHPQEKSNSRVVQYEFLDKLKAMLPTLPTTCKPIIIADAGFRFPWFSKIQEIGYDFIGRIRQKTVYRRPGKHVWRRNCLDLFKEATYKATHLGRYLFTRRWQFECEAVLYKKKSKGTTNINRSGNRTNNNASNRCARRETDPWLLVTSLTIDSVLSPEKLVALYAKRMQIEEDFRDMKSHQFGFGLRYSLSNSAKRIEVLLLLAALACLFCWLISLSAKKNNTHLDYQSNSIKTRNVLSVIYLGCQMVRKRENIVFKDIKEAYFMMQTLILEASLC